MTKKQQPAAPAQPITTAQRLEAAIYNAVTNQRHDFRTLASMMDHMAESLTHKAGDLRRAADHGSLDRAPVMRMGEIQGRGPEIDLLCRQVCDQADALQVLQAIYNKLTDEQDAARLALAVVGEVATAEIERYADMSPHEKQLEIARATITHGEIEDLLEQRAQAEEDAQLRAEGWEP
jgi:hypothetical protein